MAHITDQITRVTMADRMPPTRPLALKYRAIAAPVPYPPPIQTDWKIRPGMNHLVITFFACTGFLVFSDGGLCVCHHPAR